MKDLKSRQKIYVM